MWHTVDLVGPPQFFCFVLAEQLYKIRPRNWKICKYVYLMSDAHTFAYWYTIPKVTYILVHLNVVKSTVEEHYYLFLVHVLAHAKVPEANISVQL